MQEMGFWDHLEELRKVIFRSLIAVAVLAIFFFAIMTTLFDKVILSPCFPDFILYQWLCELNSYIGILPQFCDDGFTVELINIKLASQFFIHMSTSFWLALVFAFPIIIYNLWSFVSPALYEREKRNMRWAFVWGNLLFFMGVAIGYFLVFPLTLRFLAGYQLSASIPNQISLDSYMSNFLMLIFIMGLVFEMPILSWLLSGMGLLKRSFFKKYRRYAIVGLLVVAAFITPSSDPFTLSVVFFPLYFLYELSALFVKKGNEDEQEEEEEEKEEKDNKENPKTKDKKNDD